MDKSEILVNYIKEINKLIHKRHHHIARSQNLTLEQFHLLLFLKKSSAHPTIGDIANKFTRAQNTISEKISRLEDKGLLTRIKDSEDRRVSRVIITEEGKKLLNIINNEASNTFLHSAMDEMSDDKINNILSGLDELIINLRIKEEGHND